MSKLGVYMAEGRRERCEKEAYSQPCPGAGAGQNLPVETPMSFQHLKFTLSEVWFELNGQALGTGLRRSFKWGYDS